MSKIPAVTEHSQRDDLLIEKKQLFFSSKGAACKAYQKQAAPLEPSVLIKHRRD